MRRASVLWGVFVSRFDEALASYRRQHLTAEEAGDLLGITGRHFRRLCVRFDQEGVDGLRDRRIGRPSPRRFSASELARMLGLYREHDRDSTVKHFQVPDPHAWLSAPTTPWCCTRCGCRSRPARCGRTM